MAYKYVTYGSPHTLSKAFIKEEEIPYLRKQMTITRCHLFVVDLPEKVNMALEKCDMLIAECEKHLALNRQYKDYLEVKLKTYMEKENVSRVVSNTKQS